LEVEPEKNGSENRETSELHPAARPAKRATDATRDIKWARNFRLLAAHIRITHELTNATMRLNSSNVDKA